MMVILNFALALTACSWSGTPEASPTKMISPPFETKEISLLVETPSAGRSQVGDPSNESLSSNGSLDSASSGDEQELSRYQGATPYRSSPLFEIFYSPSVWQYVEDDGSGRFHQLHHREIEDCVLWLKSGGIGAAFIDTVDLGEIEWRVFQVQAQNVNYSVQWQDIAFIFGLAMPKPYSAGKKTPCQFAAEEVISTFEVISVPLPYTVKGYELYSWYKEPEGEWTFTLISGTDRLKTYQEITERSFAEDGWVNITVDGIQSLKFMLDRIPDRTTVTWNGPEWLERVQAEKELVETISMPDQEVIADVLAYCRQLGVELIVDEVR
jgi:hypothetical protein